MASYTTQLLDWGEQGSAWPASYSYSKNVPPIEEYDDFSMYNLIKDVKHLVTLTNTRLESSSGTSAERPASPEDGELFWNKTDSKVEVYDAGYAGWRVLSISGDVQAHVSDTANPHSVTYAQAGAIQDAAGAVSQSHLNFDPTTQPEFDSHANSTTNPHAVTAAQVGSYTTAQADAAFSEDGHTHDTRYYTKSGADSRFVDAAGDTVSGRLTVTGDSITFPVYATLADVPGTLPAGAAVFVQSESAIYVENGI